MKIVLNDNTEIPIEKVFLAEVPKDALIVIEYHGLLDKETKDYLQKLLYEIYGHKWLILDQGMTMKCIIKSQTE